MQSRAIFDAIYETVKPFVYPSMSKVVERTKSPRRTLKKRGPVRKLNMKDEFLLMLMKLRLGLLFGDLGDRFGISLGTASRIFSTWIKATSLCLKSIIYMPDDITSCVLACFVVATILFVYQCCLQCYLHCFVFMILLLN